MHLSALQVEGGSRLHVKNPQVLASPPPLYQNIKKIKKILVETLINAKK